MKIEKKYGKTPFEAIKTIGINESIMYLNSLSSNDNKVILYHRIHSTSIGISKPIDCYEIYKEGGYKEYLFINVYADENCTKIPEGYAKATTNIKPINYRGILIYKTFGVNYRIKNFPFDLIKKIKNGIF